MEVIREQILSKSNDSKINFPPITVAIDRTILSAIILFTNTKADPKNVIHNFMEQGHDKFVEAVEQIPLNERPRILQDAFLGYEAKTGFKYSNLFNIRTLLSFVHKGFVRLIVTPSVANDMHNPNILRLVEEYCVPIQVQEKDSCEFAFQQDRIVREYYRRNAIQKTYTAKTGTCFRDTYTPFVTEATMLGLDALTTQNRILHNNANKLYERQTLIREINKNMGYCYKLTNNEETVPSTLALESFIAFVKEVVRSSCIPTVCLRYNFDESGVYTPPQTSETKKDYTINSNGGTSYIVELANRGRLRGTRNSSSFSTPNRFGDI